MTNRGLFKGFGTQALKLDNKRIVSVADPVAAADVATRRYVDARWRFVLPYSYAGTLAVTTGTFRWYNDTGRALTVSAVRASVGTAPTGASVIVDLKKNGTTMYTTSGNRPTIAVSTNTVSATLPDVTSVAVGDYLTVDIAQIGSTVAGADLTVSVVMS